MSSDPPISNASNPSRPSFVPPSSVSFNASPKGKLLASRTGISKNLPDLLHDILSRFSIDLDLIDPIDYDPGELQNESLVVIVASTGADGKPPHGLECIARWLLEKAKDSCDGFSMILKGCRFAVFGVSASSRIYCSSFGQDLVRWMNTLGALRITPFGNVNLRCRPFDSIFMTWCFGLILQLRGHTSVIEEFNTSEEFGEEYEDADFSEDNGDCYELGEDNGDTGEDNGDYASAEIAVNWKAPHRDPSAPEIPLKCNMQFVEESSASDDKFDEHASGKEVVDSERRCCKVNVPERDLNVLQAILSPVTPTYPGKKSRDLPGKVSVFYFLLGHWGQHPLDADYISGKSEAYSVASLYRVEIENQGEDFKTSRSLGLPLFRFTSDKYPLGMSCGAIGSKLYLIGGNFHAPNYSPNCNANNKFYILDLCSVECLTTHEDISKIIEVKEFPYPNKTDPIVVTIHKKLFVFPSNFSSHNGTNPTINFYDPEKDEWKSFDIFEITHGGYLSLRPSLSFDYAVLKYLVEDTAVFFKLLFEVYRFDCATGKLYRVAGSSEISYMHRSINLIIHPDGCSYGLDFTRKQLVAYKEHSPHEYYQKSPYFFVLSEPTCEYMEGVVSHLSDVGEENRLLVTRSGCGVNEASKLNIVFDFLRMIKEAKGTLQCKTYSITYHMENWDGYCGHIQYCFPMGTSSICLDRSR